MFWMNWRELEKHNDWGMRKKTDAVAALWNQEADRWEQRTARETEFARRQVEALGLCPEDTVLDVCCGTGPLTLPMAAKVRKVIAFDFNENMLRYVREKAEREGISNIEMAQGNWNTLEPGRDIPMADIAVTRHSPAQGDVLKFSRCARKRCHFLSMVNGGDDLMSFMKARRGRWLKSDKEEENYEERPDGRLYGMNIHFNLLYEAGAHPEVRYVRETKTTGADTLEGLAASLFPHVEPGAVMEYLTAKAVFQDGRYTLEQTQAMSVMSWDPNEIRFDLLEQEGIV